MGGGELLGTGERERERERARERERESEGGERERPRPSGMNPLQARGRERQKVTSPRSSCDCRVLPSPNPLQSSLTHPPRPLMTWPVDRPKWTTLRLQGAACPPTTSEPRCDNLKCLRDESQGRNRRVGRRRRRGGRDRDRVSVRCTSRTRDCGS